MKFDKRQIGSLPSTQLTGVVSQSAQINYPEISNLPSGIVSGSTQLNGSTFTNVIVSGSFSGSYIGDGSNLTGIVTSVPTASATVAGKVELGSDTIQTVGASTVTSTAARTYAIQLSGSGQMVVNIPWVNTTYSEISDANLQNPASFITGLITGRRIETWANAKTLLSGSFAGITGTGTTNYVSKWTGTSAQGNSLIYDDGTTVSIAYSNNAFSQGFAVQNTNTGTQAITGILLRNSSSTDVGQLSYYPSNFSTTGLQNTVSLASVGQQKLGFIANTSNNGSVKQDIYFQTIGNGTPQIYISGSTGNVGFGTTTPIATTHIKGTNHTGTFTEGVLVIEQSGGNKMFIDGNDIDVSGSIDKTLYLQDYSGGNVKMGGNLEVVGYGGFTGSIHCGVEDKTNGIVHIHGNTTSIGGEVRIYAGATQDTTIDYWRLHSTGTSLGLRSSGADAGSLWLGSSQSTLYNPSGTGYLVLGTAETYMSDPNDQKAFSISGDHSSNTGQVKLGDWDGSGNGFWCRLDQPNSTFETNGVIKSTKATGTAPFTVASTTNVTNLNADTVDGIQAENIVYGTGTGVLGKKTTGLTDFNSGSSSGFYDGSSATGAPTADWYHLINAAHNDSTVTSPYQMQIAGNFFDLSRFYIRGVKPGTAGTWRRISHEGYIVAGGTNTQLQYNNNGVLAGFGNYNTFDIDLGKPLLLEPWTSHGSATGIGAMAYGDMTGQQNRPLWVMNSSGHNKYNSAEGQYPNSGYTHLVSTSGTTIPDWRYGGCLAITAVGNVTVSVQYVPDGASGTVLVKQDALGGRTVTIAGTAHTPQLTPIVIGSVTGVNTTALKYSTITYKRFGTDLIVVYGQQA